jgi:TIR domain/Uncharacterized protein conserved in bacteria (DUF2252)
VNLSYNAFLSYAKPDLRHASMVCKRLEAKGLRVWIAPRNIPPGANWSDAIVKAIDQSRSLVVIFSAAANQSRQVFREVDYADNRNVPLFFLRIENLEPTGTLRYFSSGTQWIDAYSPPLKAHADVLFRGVSEVLDNTSEKTRGSSTAPIGSPIPPQLQLSEQSTTERITHNPYADGWREKPRKFTKATRNYEEWLSGSTAVLTTDFVWKHNSMRQGLIPFLRSTFYRWVELFPIVCPELALSPAVMAAGDLTVEHFSVWRDAEHRLNWGINYFDEAAALPYASDLVRLGTSAYIAFRESSHTSKLDHICEQILSGYEESIDIGGRAFILEEQSARFRDTMLGNLKNPKMFWTRLASLPPVKAVPREVGEAFSAMMPGIQFRTVRRLAGLGSVGRQRIVAIGDWKGGKVAWEAKALSPPAIAWMTGRKILPAAGRNEIVRNSVRNRDPFAVVFGQWLISRLSPDFSRVEFPSFRKRDQAEWLHAMGWETANIHLGTTQAMESVKADLLQRPKKWLKRAVRRMTEAIEKDWGKWRKKSGAESA